MSGRLFLSLVFCGSLYGQTNHSDWPKYCANLEMTGVAQSGGAISPLSAGNLAKRWSVKLGGPIASSPTVVNDVVYVGDWSGIEWARLAGDGSLLANIDLGVTTMPQCDPATIGITSAAAVQDGVVYVAGGNDSFYALDANSLDVIWSRRLGDNSAGGGYYGWCSPAVTNVSVVQGISSNCDDPFIPGRVVAMELSDGAMMKDTLIVEPEWPHDSTGGGVWTSPAVDTINHDVFVTTGSAFDINDGRAFSIVRLSMDTMEVLESWKVNANAQEDADWGTSPTLFHDADGRQLVGAGQKDGHYYAFERRHIEDGPVWTTELAKGGACPLCGDGVLSTAAFDGRRLYVGAGRPPDATNVDDSVVGSVSALDATTGAVLWRQHFDSPVIAPISFTNGVVFTTVGKRVVALDAESGALLWQAQTKAPCVGGVAITDRGIFFGDLSGTLYHFDVQPPSRTRAVRAR